MSLAAKTVKTGLAAALGLWLLAADASAAELVMLEEAGCSWCRAWDEEVGAIYHKTPEGRRAPLRRLDINSQLPEDLEGLNVGRFTPTFILMEGGKEIGRIRGYPGEAFFWGLFGEMLEKLPRPATPSS